jgi:hypothetical protein
MGLFRPDCNCTLDRRHLAWPVRHLVRLFASELLSPNYQVIFEHRTNLSEPMIGPSHEFASPKAVRCIDVITQ